MKYLTLSTSENKFTFTCPIFNVNTQMAACTKLRELIWKGRSPSVRRGCQACMRASKCPAAEIVRRISFGRGKVADDYGSTEPIHGKLRKDVLERIHRTIVTDTVLNEFGVSSAERLLIESSIERIGKMIGAAPLPTDGYRRTVFEEKPSKTKPKRAKESAPINQPKDSVSEAAMSGNLAAAVNEE